VVFFFFFPVLDRALAALDGDDREDDGLRSVEGVPSPRATRSMGKRRMASEPKIPLFGPCYKFHAYVVGLCRVYRTCRLNLGPTSC
jgi:hypothetical protein